MGTKIDLNFFLVEKKKLKRRHWYVTRLYALFIIKSRFIFDTRKSFHFLLGDKKKIGERKCKERYFPYAVKPKKTIKNNLMTASFE